MSAASAPAEPRRRTRRKPWILVALTGVGGGLAHAVFHVGARHLGSPVAWIVAPLAVAGLVAAVVAKRRERRVRAKERYEREDAQHPYDLKVFVRPGGDGTKRSLVLTDVALEFDAPASPDLAAVFGDGGVPGEIPLRSVREVRVEAKQVVLVHDERGLPWPVRLEPSKEDRDRLLWELALRCPDAVERGLAAAA